MQRLRLLVGGDSLFVVFRYVLLFLGWDSVCSVCCEMTSVFVERFLE